jgi:hypothetical protein
MHVYARLHWDNISGFFGDPKLEVSVFDRWSAAIAPKADAEAPRVDFLHVATQLYGQGGHSRLLRKLMQGLDAFGTQGIILTGPRRGSHLSGLSVDPARISGSPSRRLAQLVQAGRMADTVLLHIHPDDSIAALAARQLRNEGRRVLFVNHADHVFSLGPSAASAVLEICVTGWRTTEERRGVQAHGFMGIPVADSTDTAPIWRGDRYGPIVSMGGPGKFKPNAPLSFPEFLARVLPLVPNEVVLIGPSIKDPWWADVMARFPGRVRLMGPLDPDHVAKIMQTASCYIDSFPLDGGTAYPQTALMGVPCFGPNADNAPGVSPTDQLRFQSLSDMEAAVVGYLQGGDYPFDLNAVRRQIQEDFSVASIAHRVAQARDGVLQAPFDYLKRLGKRGPDYNAHRWEADGVLHLPKRQWRGLSLGTRRRLIDRVRSAGLPTAIEKELLYRIRTNWV